jgi:titin
VSFDESGQVYYYSESGITGSMVGDRKSAHYVLDLKIKFGTKPGTYDCYMYGRDTAMHMGNWTFQSKLEVTRTGGIYDDEGPAISGFSFDQPSYEVGVADAPLRVEFDASDATGISWVSGICWGNNTNTYPLNFSVSFDESGQVYYYSESGITGSMVGDSKSAHYVLDLKIKFGTKPGTYDCYMYGRDTAMHMGNWTFQSKLNVFRTPPGMPDAPTSLQLSQDRPGRGVLSWDAPNFLGSPALKDYVIQVSEDGQTWKDLVDGYSTTTNLPLDNLKNDTDYWFRVRGENGGAAGANTDYMVLNWGQLQVHTLAARVPDAPTDLVISTVSANGFNLTWAAPTFDGGKSITDFTVEVSSDSGATWRSAKTDASTSLSYSVFGASPGTNYLVRVAAKNEAGLSSYLEGSLRTLATIPGAPLNLKISKVSYRTLTLGWSLPSSNGGSAITNYKIEFSSDEGATWTEISHAVSASRSFNVTGLTRGKTYKFRVSAINVVGVGMATTPASATTLLATASAPQSLTTANVTSESADLSWTAPSDNGGAPIIRYNIEISSNGGTTWFKNGWTIGTKPQWYFAPLNPGTTYTYRVTPVTKAGSGASATGTFTTLAVLPQAPRNAKVSEITGSGLTISWSLPLSNGGSPILDYLVEMSSDGGGTWKPVPHTASNNLALIVTGLPAGTKRWFRVSTVTAVGTSEAFTSTSAVTLGNAPAAPTAVKVSSRTSTTVTITWSQAQVVGGSPVRNFVIEFSKDGGSTWLTAKSAVTKAQSSTISGFKSGTNYKIRVRAVNDVGSSAASTFVSVTTR